MYPWLRLIGVSASALQQARRSRIELFEPTRVSLRVWPDDLDSNLHVNNGRYLTLADLGGIAWFLRSGVLSRARRFRAAPVVADACAKFRRELKLLQPFEIETRLLGWERRSIFLEHRFLVDEHVSGVVGVSCVFKSGRRTVYPSELLGGLSTRTQSPVLPAWVSQFSDSCEALAQQLHEEERGPERLPSATERQRLN
jgi:acyl-CoA thioesterase FadM